MKKITDNVYKIHAGSNVYLVDKKILIDTGMKEYSSSLKEIDCDSITTIVFTHLHFDHIGNFELFKNAKFYASKKEIWFFERNALGSVLDRELVKKFKVKLHDVTELKMFKIIETPGHTIGSICLLYKNLLFSGDTLFDCGCGRTDLPSSVDCEMKSSLKKLEKVKYKYLCPGHDY